MYFEFEKYLSEKIPFTAAQYDETCKLLHFKSLCRNEPLLLSEGNHWGAFVLKGCLRSFVRKNEDEHIIQFAPENWWIFDKNSSTISGSILYEIDAVEDSAILLFDHDYMLNAEKIIPEAYKMHRNLEQNGIKSLQKRIYYLLASTAEERYLYFTETYPKLATRLPQWMIASYLGMEPQSLSRIRRNLVPKLG